MRTIYACTFEWGNGHEHACVFATQDRGHFVMHQERGIHEAADYAAYGVQSVIEEAPDEEPQEGPEPEEESIGIVIAAELNLDILGRWIGWEGWEGTVRNEIQTFRAGRLESVNVPKYDNGNGVQIVVSGVPYSVPRFTRFVWKKP